MGAEVVATCSCGYETSSLIGGGMLNFDRVCIFPALCEDCRLLVSVNLYEDSPKCPQCKKENIIPYGHTRLVGKKSRSVVVDWHVKDRLGRVLKLHKGTYYCPACGEFNLRFSDSGLCWD